MGHGLLRLEGKTVSARKCSNSFSLTTMLGVLHFRMGAPHGDVLRFFAIDRYAGRHLWKSRTGYAMVSFDPILFGLPETAKLGVNGRLAGGESWSGDRICVRTHRS